MDHLHFLYFSYDVIYLLDHLNLLWNLHNSFSYLDYGNYLFNYPVYNLIFNFDVIFDFPGTAILNYGDYFFYYFFDLNDLRDFDNSLDNFLHKDWDFNDLLNNLLHWDDLFMDYLHFLILDLNVVHNSFNLDRSVNFHNFISKDLNFMYFWNLFMKLNYFFNNSRDLNDCLDLTFIRNELFYLSLDY